jgi:hypothetical protein
MTEQEEQTWTIRGRGPYWTPQLLGPHLPVGEEIALTPESRVQELEGQLEATLNLNRQHVERCRALDQERWAAESHLARLEEAVKQIADGRPSHALHDRGWYSRVAQAALTHSTPPSAHQISSQSVSGSTGEPND